MSRHWRCLLLLIALVIPSAERTAFSQTQIPALKEIRVPIPPSRGAFGGGFLVPSVPAHGRFAVRLLPDQRLLVMNPNHTGQWSLTRIGNWSTESPELESLVVPGWTSANVHREGGIDTTVLVTPDGQFALVVSGVEQVKNAAQIPFPPKQPIAGMPDTLIVLVDLKTWRVIGALHTATLGDITIRRAQTVGGKWVALEGYFRHSSSVYKRINQLISIPDLKTGPNCISTESRSLVVQHHSDPEIAEAAEEVLAHRNNAVCGEFVKAANFPSFHRYESFMFLGTEPPPETYQPPKQFPRKFSTGTGPVDERNFNHDEMVGRERWGYTPDDNYFYFYNPPFESRSGYWYEFQFDEIGRGYALAKYDNSGKTLLVSPTTLLQRGSPSGPWCWCRIEDVREESNSLLAYCHSFTVGFADVHHPKAQWLTIFRTNDLSEVAIIPMSKDRETKRVLATANGISYVLVVEQGEILRVYQVNR